MHLAETKQINLDKMVNIEPGDLVLGSGLMGYFFIKTWPQHLYIQYV